MKINIGLDVGASHIAIGTVTKNGIIEYRDSVLYVSKNNNESFILEIKKVIDRFIKNNEINIKDIGKIGIAVPGNCSNGILTGGAKNLKLENVKIREELNKHYNAQIEVENDAVCALIAEREYGNLKDNPNSIMLTFGTGMGYAISIKKDEQLYFASDEQRDYLNDFNIQFKERVIGLHEFKLIYAKQIENDNIKRTTIFEDIKNNQPIAIDMFNKYIKNNCKGIERISKLTGIKCFCIGGGLSEYEEFFIKKMQKELPKLHICISKYKNDSAIIGSATLPYVQAEIVADNKNICYNVNTNPINGIFN